MKKRVLLYFFVPASIVASIIYFSQHIHEDAPFFLAIAIIILGVLYS